MKASTFKNKLGKFQYVVSMKTNSGADAPNQFKIYFDNGTIFQS